MVCCRCFASRGSNCRRSSPARPVQAEAQTCTVEENAPHVQSGCFNSWYRLGTRGVESECVRDPAADAKQSAWPCMLTTARLTIRRCDVTNMAVSYNDHFVPGRFALGKHCLNGRPRDSLYTINCAAPEVNARVSNPACCGAAHAPITAKMRGDFGWLKESAISAQRKPGDPKNWRPGSLRCEHEADIPLIADTESNLASLSDGPRTTLMPGGPEVS